MGDCSGRKFHGEIDRRINTQSVCCECACVCVCLLCMCVSSVCVCEWDCAAKLWISCSQSGHVKHFSHMAIRWRRCLRSIEC